MRKAEYLLSNGSGRFWSIVRESNSYVAKCYNTDDITKYTTWDYTFTSGSESNGGFTFGNNKLWTYNYSGSLSSGLQRVRSYNVVENQAITQSTTFVHETDDTDTLFIEDDDITYNLFGPYYMGFYDNHILLARRIQRSNSLPLSERFYLVLQKFTTDGTFVDYLVITTSPFNRPQDVEDVTIHNNRLLISNGTSVSTDIPIRLTQTREIHSYYLADF